ncbi:MAG: starch-binding protein, partial [Clostridia bacterium]|nr:starch-binding protein [Clostridia bacterium]
VYDGDDNRNQLAIVAPVASKAYYNTYRTYGFASATTASGAEMNCVYKDPKTGTTRLYFYNSQRWKTVYAYGYWTYTAANNANVEDFGGWPGTTMYPDERENWYYIDLPQDIDKIKTAPYNVTNGIGIVFNDSKSGRAELAISNKTNVYINYKAEAKSSYVAIESVTEMVDPMPPIDDFMLDFSQLTSEGKTDSVTNKADLTAAIVVVSVAGALLIATGTVFAVFTIRRNKKYDK